MIRYFLFSFFLFFTKNLLATDYSFHEKVSGEAFSTFSEGESSYLYNPSIKGTQAHHFILPLGLEFFGNDYLITVLSQKLKNLKGSEEDIVKFLRESNKKDLTARLRTSTAYMNQSIVVAFHTKMEFEAELRDSYLGGEELEFYSSLDFNLTFSYNRPFLKYFGAGFAATTR